VQIGQNELRWIGDKDFAPIFRKSIDKPESLTKNEIHQLNSWNIMFLIGRSNNF
jgi:hypothetical protein